MTENKVPEESEKTIYQRDKTAQEPVAEDAKAQAPAKPIIKPRKAFKAKKFEEDVNKPRDLRTRHILLSTLETAAMIRQILLDFEKELAEQPSDDPDKEFDDRKKLENFFARIAKKYSICKSKAIGGEVGWVYRGMNVPEETLTADLVEAISKTRKFAIPEPIRTELGVHLIMVCETRLRATETVEKPSELDPRYEALMQDPDAQKPTRKDIPT